ncbi:MAG: hypothetical protein QW040_01545 [Candidatus Aenigmatarchaeota archaeon]
MKIVWAAIIFLIGVATIAGYFLFFSEMEEIAPQTTTTTLQTTTTEVRIGEKITVTKNEVFIYSDKFEPSQLTIKAGEKVKWVNKDNKQHELVCVSANQALFDVILYKEEFWEFSFNETTECWDPSVSEETMRMSITVS